MLVVLGVVVSVLAASPTAEDVQRATRRVLDTSYQQSIPGAPQVDRPEGGREARYRIRVAPRQEPRSERAAPGFLGTAATWLMWVVAATVLIVLVAWGAQELLVYADDPVAGNDGDRAERDQRARVVARPLARAEELAADGRFGEAIRALLLRTLGELVRATPERLPPSLTSREILSSVALDDTARHLLGELVQAVEVSHFGGKDPGAAEYGRCLDVFRAFATTYVGGRVG